MYIEYIRQLQFASLAVISSHWSLYTGYQHKQTVYVDFPK